MILQELCVAGYRSVRDLRLALGGVNVLVGPNGCGKTNLYRAMYLLHRAAEGRLAVTLAEEGGMPSVLWAGERKKGPVRMVLEARFEEFTYRLKCGLPQLAGSAFILDPVIKEEHVWFESGDKRVCLLDREQGRVIARNADGKKVMFALTFSPSESILSELREPEQFPVLSRLRQELLSWRFYHQFRTDAYSPVREPQPGVRTPVLSHDGHDLAAALQTIFENGDGRGLTEAVAQAFGGAALDVGFPPECPRFCVRLRMPDFQRPFDARELSDGTLHYLCMLAALFSPRPPTLLAINEPETSIHPDLLPPLAQWIARASRDSQIWLTTHSEVLAAQVAAHTPTHMIRLERHDGATRLACLAASDDGQPD